MKKILLIILLPLFLFSQEIITNSDGREILLNSDGSWKFIYDGNEGLGFRGIWKVDDRSGYYIIWKDFDSNQFHCLYMNNKNDTTQELEVQLLTPNKLKVKTIFVQNQWVVNKTLHLIDENTIKVTGQHPEGHYEDILKRFH